MSTATWRRWAGALGLVLALLGAGCATVPGGAPAGAAPAPQAGTPEDPWERFNRSIFTFNEAVDEAVLKPVATAYRKVVPELVRKGVSNFFGNLDDAWSAVNHLLQGKPGASLEMGMRVATNTIVGLGGLLDPASELGITKRSEDFGQTLGRWGLGPGPYLMLPFLGPSTVRDTVGRVADRQVSASNWVASEAVGYGLTTLELVNVRASLLDTTRLLDGVALDKYSFLRQAYLARRLDAVYDGAPPAVSFPDDDPESEANAPAAPTKAVPAPPPPKSRP